MRLSLKMKIVVDSYQNERLITFADQNQRWQMFITRAIPLLISEIKSAEDMANLVFWTAEQAKVHEETFTITEEERRQYLFFNQIRNEDCLVLGQRIFPYTTLPTMWI